VAPAKRRCLPDDTAALVTPLSHAVIGHPPIHLRATQRMRATVLPPHFSQAARSLQTASRTRIAYLSLSACTACRRTSRPDQVWRAASSARIRSAFASTSGAHLPLFQGALSGHQEPLAHCYQLPCHSDHLPFSSVVFVFRSAKVWIFFGRDRFPQSTSSANISLFPTYMIHSNQ
jgi:hypothetical protein